MGESRDDSAFRNNSWSPRIAFNSFIGRKRSPEDSPRSVNSIPSPTHSYEFHDPQCTSCTIFNPPASVRMYECDDCRAKRSLISGAPPISEVVQVKTLAHRKGSVERTDIVTVGGYRCVMKTVDYVEANDSERHYSNIHAKVIRLVPRHRHLLQVLQTEHLAQCFRSFYELLDTDLRSYIKLKKQYDPMGISTKDASRVARHVISGIERLHSKSIVHRDIKSENIFVNYNTASVEEDTKVMRAVVGDFDVAIFADGEYGTDSDDVDAASRERRTFAGSPGFMPPELLCPDPNSTDCYSKAIDVFAYGIFLFEMCSGDDPFPECPYAHQVNECVANGKVPEWSQDLMNRHSGLYQVFLKCVVPKQRRPSAKKIAKILRDVREV